MKVYEVLQQETFDAKKFYSYFSDEDIITVPYELLDIINDKEINDFTFSNLHDLLIELYCSIEIMEKDFNYIDRKLIELNFFENFSEFLYSQSQIKKEFTIHIFIDVGDKNNCKYLEKAYEKEYYKNDILSGYKCLQGLGYLKSKKLKTYKKQLCKEKDIINFYVFALIGNSKEINKILKLYKNELWLKNIPINNLEKYIEEYEIFVSNIIGSNKIECFRREEYIKSIEYFKKIYSDYQITDFFEFYKNVWNEIKKNT